MDAVSLVATYIGGPTALLEVGGFRLLTDPTFDRAGREYTPGPYTLRKTMAPACGPESIGQVDVILLSHDHHFDNLDEAGRRFLSNARYVFTTRTAAERLGGNSRGLSAWEKVSVSAADGRSLEVIGTPARHGLEGADRGPVTGFVVQFGDKLEKGIYVSGDTVWFEGVAEVGRRFSIAAAFLFLGAARVPEVGPSHLTMTAAEGVEVARSLPSARIIPLHFEGWAHFSESRQVIQSAFVQAGLEPRLVWPVAGKAIPIPL